VSVPRSIDDPLLNHAVNITGTLNVLLAARDAGVRKHFVADISKAIKDFGAVPEYDLLQGLSEMVITGT